MTFGKRLLITLFAMLVTSEMLQQVGAKNLCR